MIYVYLKLNNCTFLAAENNINNWIFSVQYGGVKGGDKGTHYFILMTNHIHILAEEPDREQFVEE
ncbi:MAG: hypothetical protein EOL87_17050 [Spartobacteria bacterium]|nr:hypothetical protein [Spartobacteria bacterium]